MKTNYTQLLFLSIILLTGCTKEMLERKPDQSLVVPATLTDFKALLDNAFSNPLTGLEISAGDYEVTFEDWQAMTSARSRNMYIWNADINEGSQLVTEWDDSYEQVFYANVVLDGLADINRNISNQVEYDNVHGTALFQRSYAFYNLLQYFAPAYGGEAEEQLGIPLRLTADINDPSVRATLSDCYQQVANDLKSALELVPSAQPFRTQPNRAAVATLLAKVFLAKGDFEQTNIYAARALEENHSLLDLNELDISDDFPFPQFNDEVLFHRNIPLDISFIAPRCKIDADLYRSYAQNDLRRSLYFVENPDGSVSFKGNYTGTRIPFGGLAWDETYLMKAESDARLGRTDEAMLTLNALLETRYRTGSFVPLSVSNAHDALSAVLLEMELLPLKRDRFRQ
ncbi:RagB/SusD family nutrient uptake outer membrane protein [Olivibacter sp. SDN3]|uniref:RagB/SusD family nutrient uptake outer membrane protein n=1 Tax=Olivibacter sp. SDN3 TaxID=2764720 RepID=UPI00165159FA|nr:RagB/SusD family nutrient uptake outer membrane protein [Olivibacter sp. SDN3]QNL51964.1 RagB/SusD family nutrient uptake outer membrane protein [Olivibacter sp. SDN3]